MIPAKQDINRYILHEEINRNNASIVYKVFDNITESIVVIKKIPSVGTINVEIMEQFNDYVNLMIRLQNYANKKVLELLDYRKDNMYAYIVTKYCKGGSLRTLMNLHNSIIKETKMLNIIKQICLIFIELQKSADLYDNVIVHGNIKPENILFTDENHCNVILADFKSKKYQNLSEYSYIALEDINGVEYSTRSDIYSLGMIIYECLIGSRLMNEQVDNLPHRRPANHESQWSRISNATQDLILKMLMCSKEDNNNKFEWKEILNHVAITKIRIINEIKEDEIEFLQSLLNIEKAKVANLVRELDLVRKKNVELELEIKKLEPKADKQHLAIPNNEPLTLENQKPPIIKSQSLPFLRMINDQQIEAAIKPPNCNDNNANQSNKLFISPSKEDVPEKYSNKSIPKAKIIDVTKNNIPFQFIGEEESFQVIQEYPKPQSLSDDEANEDKVSKINPEHKKPYIEDFPLRKVAKIDSSSNTDFIQPQTKTTYDLQVQQNDLIDSTEFSIQIKPKTSEHQIPISMTMNMNSQLKYALMRNQATQSISTTQHKNEDTISLKIENSINIKKTIDEHNLGLDKTKDSNTLLLEVIDKLQAKIQHLEIKNSFFDKQYVINDEIETLFQGISKLNQLNELNLSFENIIISDNILDKLAKAISQLQSLTTLQLNFNKNLLLTDNSMTQLARAISNLSMLKAFYIDLEETPMISDTGFYCIVKAIRSKNLSELRLNFSGNQDLSINAIELILSVISDLKHLKIFQLYLNRNPNLTDHELSKIAEMLTKLDQLSNFHLDLGSVSNITDEGIKELSKSLTNLALLQRVYLDFDDNEQLTDVSAKEIINALEHLKHLSVVEIFFNCLTTEGHQLLINLSNKYSESKK